MNFVRGKNLSASKNSTVKLGLNIELSFLPTGKFPLHQLRKNRVARQSPPPDFCVAILKTGALPQTHIFYEKQFSIRRS